VAIVKEINIRNVSLKNVLHFISTLIAGVGVSQSYRLFNVIAGDFFAALPFPILLIPLSYYFDSQNGKDSNDGLSVNSAWKSHTKVESANLQAGDVVYFMRGSAWEGGIQIDASGSMAIIW
jgi:hypothetical protein